MGIFSRKPKLPDPYISVTLDDQCRGACFPGTQVSGTVTLQSPVQRHITVAQASLSGHAKTHSYKTEGSGNNSSTIYFQDDATLFEVDQNLSHNTIVPQDQICFWRFEFQFPHTSGLVGSTPYTGATATSGIYANDLHPLPPSFSLMRSAHEYAIVEYKVQASFQFDGEKEPFVMDFAPLNLVPYNPRPQQPSFAEFIKPAQQYSSSRLIGCEKSFKHSLRDKFSSQTPSVKVVMKTTVPPNLAPSGSFPIYACVEIDSFSDPAIDVPVVNIKITSLKLCQYTFYRSIRSRGVSVHNREHQATHEELVPLNAVPEWCEVERREGTSGDRKYVYFPASFEARIPGATCPSFQTFNINHNFQLEFKLEAEVCGKKFEFKVDVPNVVVYPN